MKILLLQSSVYFPSFGGGNKSNRLLLEALVKRGHECYSISKSVDAQKVVDQSSEKKVLQDRGIQSNRVESGISEYDYQGVHVFSINTSSVDSDNNQLNIQQFFEQQYGKLKPDIILVSDDKNANLLNLSLKLSVDTTVLVVHTNLHLPFGDEASKVNHSVAGNYRRCKHLLTSTKYSKDYLQKEADITSTYLPFPVFGEPPFENIAQFNRGCIGMINPCAIKGIDIFIQLAKVFPHLGFLAVPTWGANAEDIRRLEQLDNMRVLPPQDNIENILKHLNILIVPSLIQETFGYVTVEAMLRGIPVLASDLGGLRDAKLGVDYLLPVTPAINCQGQHKVPNQDITKWRQTLQLLTENKELYEQCSERSYRAANDYMSTIKIEKFELYLNNISSPHSAL